MAGRGTRSLGGRWVPALPVLLLALLPWVTSCSQSDDLDATDAPPVLLDQTDEDPSGTGAADDRARRGTDSMVLEFSGGQGSDLLANSGRPPPARLAGDPPGRRRWSPAATRRTGRRSGSRASTRRPRTSRSSRSRSRGLDDLLSPGGRDFAFGADVALDDVTTGTAPDNGDNLVQRGLYQSSSQYKIQVDDGRVSCRVAGVSGEIVVYAPGRLHPGDWYRIRCQRDGEPRDPRRGAADRVRPGALAEPQRDRPRSGRC